MPNLKTFSKRGWLPDVNVLFALSASQHIGFRAATGWLKGVAGSRFFLCPITEAGLVRLVASPQVGGQSLGGGVEFLRAVRALDNCGHIPIMDSWLDLIEPFASRLQGHSQVTDALLLGLAIRNDLVLVTLDRGFETMAGEQFKANVLTLGHGPPARTGPAPVKHSFAQARPRTRKLLSCSPRLIRGKGMTRL